MSNQLSKNTSRLKTLIQGDAFKSELAKTLPRHLSPDRFARIAITALTRTPKLADCTQASLFKCLLDLSATGLEPDGRRAYLIPYGKECTLIISYMGLVELIRRSGDVVSIRAETVCEKDEFSWENGEVAHKVNWRAPRGDIQAVYAEARMKSGEVQTATMTLEEVNNIRDRSRSGKSGPWVTDYAEMAKKTAVRRLSKMLPLSFEITEAIDRADKPFDDIKRAHSEAPEPFKGFGGDDEEIPEEADARPLIDDDRVQFIKDRLKDEDKDEKWFMGLVKQACPESPAKSIEQLTQEESSAAITAWEAA